MIERTLSILKPDAVRRGLTGKINFVLMINNEDREFQKYKQELRKINHFK